MIQHINHDLTTYPADVLVHQCNCQGKMGAGIALTIRKKLLSPDQFAEYVRLCNKYHGQLLGKIQWCPLPDGRRVANLFGQEYYGRTGCHTDYHAVKQGLAKIEQECRNHNLHTVAMPDHMGCSLGGGDWNRLIKECIEPVFANSPITLSICKYA